MKKLLIFLLILLLAIPMAMPAAAEDGNAIYSGDAGEFIFEPGSLYSPTDLFPNFKGVMPGDSLTQKITVRNDASNKVKVDIYMRSLGAHPDSVEFLSQMRLRVQKSSDNDMAYMFDAAADQTAQLTDWVLLGTLYSGGQVNLDVILDVPVEMDNEYQQKIGYLDWEFRIEEFEIEDTDPKPPQTGDASAVWLWIALLTVSSLLLLLIFFLRKRKKKEDEKSTQEQ